MLFLVFLSLVTIASAQDCPDIKKAPLCPNSGSTLLDDTYPNQAFVISTEGFNTNKKNNPSSQAFKESNLLLPSQFVTSIMLSYSSNYPEILVPSSAYDFEELKLAVSKNLQVANVPQAKIDQQLAKIKMVDAPSYTWQQDFFESFANLETGKPDLRAISSYAKTPISSSDYTTAISSSLECGTVGAPLQDQKTKTSVSSLNSADKSWGNGEMGGNIEGLPGGLCLKGNNQAKAFVSQYCGSEENFVEVEVGWLDVGHTDELIKVIPTSPKVSPPECSFSIMVASPEAGLETLKDPVYANRAFIELNTKDPGAIETKMKDIVNSGSGKSLCEILKKSHKESSNDAKGKNKGTGASQAFIKVLSLFSFNAFAGSGGKSTSTFSCVNALKEITNRKMEELLSKDQTFVDTNKLVQEKMNKAKSTMAAKLKERMPQCKNINFIDVPDIFYNPGLFAEINGVKELPQPGMINSLFPNPTNSVLANETLIVSEAPNYAFNDKLSKQLKQVGLKSTFVDTWNYAHAGNGNMHCTSHSIPYCQPRGNK